MIFILICTIVTYESPTYDGVPFPDYAYGQQNVLSSLFFPHSVWNKIFKEQLFNRAKIKFWIDMYTSRTQLTV